MSLLSSFTSFLKNFANTEEAALLPLAAAAVGSVASSPSLANGVAQGNAFLAQALAAQASIAKEELQDLANTLQALSAKVAATQPSTTVAPPKAAAATAGSPAPTGPSA